MASSYEDWRSMFSPEMETISIGKSKHLRKLDLLLHVFDREVEAIKTNMLHKYKAVESLPKLNRTEAKPLVSPTIFVKPSNMRCLQRSQASTTGNKLLPGPKDSPDMFNHSVGANSLNQNIQSSDIETIMSSPEKYSPKIKKKRILKLTKTKQLAEDIKQPTVCTPKANATDFDEMIEGTPEVKTFFKSSARTSAKKKLFEKSAPKKSQSMYTLSQMYKNQSIKSKSASAPESSICERSQKSNDGRKTLISQEENDTNMINLDDLLSDIENEQDVNDDTLICNTFKEACNKQKCRLCALKNSPCSKHALRPVLHEPDQTFTGFWDMDFSVNRKESKPNNIKDADDSSQNSTIFGY